MYISNYDESDVDVSTWLSQITPSTTIQITNTANITEFITIRVVAVEANSGFYFIHYTSMYNTSLTNNSVFSISYVLPGLSGSPGDTGTTGDTGTAGSKIYSGVGVPDPGVGNVGDYYLDTSTGILYGPKA